MNNLKQKNIGGKSIVLKTVPARDARKLQMYLAALLSEPLATALPQEAGQAINNLSGMAKGIVMGVGAFAGLFAKLNEGDADKLILEASRFILVDGEPFDENKHFSGDTLLDLYEAVWFFYSETYKLFFVETRSRFPQIEAALKKLKELQAQTSTGSSGGHA